MLRILLAGSDSGLLETRAAVLLKTGASVFHRNASGAIDILDLEVFDLVVLCHSLLEADVAMIVEKVRQKIPGTKILLVTSELNKYGSHTDSKVDATSIPEPVELVARVKELLPVPSYASSKGRDGAVQTQLVVD